MPINGEMFHWSYHSFNLKLQITMAIVYILGQALCVFWDTESLSHAILHTHSILELITIGQGTKSSNLPRKLKSSD